MIKVRRRDDGHWTHPLRVIWTGGWRSFSKGTIRYYAGEFTGWRESYELWPAGDLAV